MELIDEDISVTCCFSGHRPEKLYGNGDVKNSPELRRLLSVLRLAIEDAVREGYRVFVTGMARGVDMWAARFVLELKAKRDDIKLVCVLPFRGQVKGTKGVERYDYNCILKAADQVVCLSEDYQKGCMRKRNCYMVDHSSKLIAVVSDYRSGTGQTIAYARKKGIDTHIIDVKENRLLFEATV